MEFNLDDIALDNVELLDLGNITEEKTPADSGNDVKPKTAIPGSTDPIETPTPTPENQEEHTEIIDPEESAELITDILELGNKYVMPWLYRKAAFSKDETLEIKDLVRLSKLAKEKEEKLEINKNELHLLELFDDSIYYEEEIVPYTETELEKIKRPLSKLLQNFKIKTSPLAALCITLVMTTIPRLIPLFGLSKARKNREDLKAISNEKR